MSRFLYASFAGLLAVSVAALDCGAPTRARPAAPPAPALPADPFASLDRVMRAARAGFHRDSALALVHVADRGFRTRGNAAFVAVLDAVEHHLREAGFVTEAGAPAGAAATIHREPLTLSAPVWDAHAASLDVLEPAPEHLLGFDAQDDTNRTMLPAFSGRGDVRGELAVWQPGARQRVRGKVVLTDLPAGRVARDAADAGAVAVLSSHVEPVNDTAHHRDTVRYELLPGLGPQGLVLHNISPAVDDRLRELLRHGKVVVRAQADVSITTGRTDTLVARIEGTRADAEPVLVVAHVDEPGANDNGSGVGTVAEAAATYVRLVADGTLPRPARPVLFLFGMEIEQSAHWLEAHPQARPAFAVSVDMAGEPPAVAPMLIERMPDPGARRVRPPDEHTEWGAGRAPDAWFHGAFLNGLAVETMGRVEPGWTVRDHPYEGGSDHVPFLRRGVPALLFWHFPDDAYHTNRDRFARVSADEMTRVGTGVLALVALGAAGTEAAVIEVLAVNDRYARARFGVELASSQRAVGQAPMSGPARAAAVARERAHLAAWGTYFDEALESCGALGVAPSTGVAAAIADARARLRTTVSDGIGSLR